MDLRIAQASLFGGILLILVATTPRVLAHPQSGRSSAEPGRSAVRVSLDASTSDRPPSPGSHKQPPALAAMNVGQAWTRTTGRPEVRIAVIDGRFGPNLAPAGMSVQPGEDFVDMEPKEASSLSHIDYSGRDAEPTGLRPGHGALVVRAIGGPGGTCPSCTVMPIRAGAPVRQIESRDTTVQTQFQDEDVAAAIRWAVDQGADVINLSLGFEQPTEPLARAINYAYAEGILIIGAAGNQGADQPLFPAAYPHVLAVGATDPNGQPASYSNGASKVPIGAPGWRSRLDRPQPDRPAQGTSLSAAYVSGIAGLVRSANPDLPAAHIRARIRQAGTRSGFAVDARRALPDSTGPTLRAQRR